MGIVFSPSTAAVRFCCAAFLVLGAAWLSGCVFVGTLSSGRPVYPATWPALDTARACPDISGTYRAVSEEAAPLVYPPGAQPVKVFFLIPYGRPKPAPLGRRILPWHLAGAFPSSNKEDWSALTRYAAALEKNNGAGWVRVQQTGAGFGVSAGLEDETLFHVMLNNEPQELWGNYTSHAFECGKGGIAVVGCFPPPGAENPEGLSNAVVNAYFTFYRAVDGSLVALEEAVGGLPGGNPEFSKWWRWQPVK